MKITDLPPASPFNGTEQLPVVQGGQTRRASYGELADGSAALANYRQTIAEGLTDFAVGTYFVSTDDGAVTTRPGELRRYKRISSAPYWQDMGDAAAPISKSAFDKVQARAGGAPRSTHPRNAVVCWIGDSVTDPTSYIAGAANALYGTGGVFEGWTVYNSAYNGSYLREWASSIAAGDQNAAPVNAPDATKNLWRLKNADPDEIIIMLGLNDFRKYNNGPGNYPNLAAAEAGIKADLVKVVDWLLENTRATIELQVPPPMTYIAGSATGFCDFANAQDAANRNAAMRRIYRALRGYAGRVDVLDLHRALFPAGTADSALRWDSLAASVDPDKATTVIKVDELHLTPWGEVLRAYAMHRRRVPSLPYNGNIRPPWTALHQNLALRHMRAVVKAVGAGYIDIYSDSPQNIIGNNNYGSTLRGALNNVYRLQDMWAMGAHGLLNDFLRATQFKVYDSLGAVTTITPTAITHNAVDGGPGDYFRVSVSGTPTTALGLADLYIDSLTALPGMPALYAPISLKIIGSLATKADRVVVPRVKGLPPLSSASVQMTRQSAPDACTVDLYISNVWNGSLDATDPAYDAAVPGLKMGTISMANGYVMNSTWAASTLGAALGGVVPALQYPSDNVSLYAVVASGSIGDWANITIKT